MIPTAVQTMDTPQIRYSHLPKFKAEKPLRNKVEILTKREKHLRSIAFLTQYMEDLKAGRPVENLSPSNDPYFLIPENIAGMIRGEKDIMNGRVIEIEDPKNIWASLGIE
jgi:hypothetical protein